MSKRRRSRAEEIARNIFFIGFAILVVVIFFNLDIMNKGESLFSRTTTADIRFSGDMGEKDYTAKELGRLRGYLKTHKKLVREITIQAAPQDSYKKIQPSTDILFEVHVVMHDGFTFTTPLRRTSREDLTKSIMSKLDKDIRAYSTLKKDGQKAKTMINTM